MSGVMVYLVGAGPGRADLITVRGLNILKLADVVIYDYLADKTLLKEARPDAELISCGQLGKEAYAGGSLSAQKKINDLLIRRAKSGKKVARIKNGDPAIFSRCSEEIRALIKHKIKFEIVPGVTAASAASSFTGALLTDRKSSSSVCILTGHEAGGKKKTSLDWKAIASFKTIVIYMGVNNISLIGAELRKAGKPGHTPAIAVSMAGYIDQKTVKGTLKNIVEKVKRAGVRPPAVFIIGKTAELEKDFNWTRKNKRVLFTGLSEERYFVDGTYWHVPLIDIEPMEDYREFDEYLRKISEFDWVVFASRYGVEYFFKRLKDTGSDSRALGNIKTAAVGNSTKARLLGFGIAADLVPVKESSEGLIKEFQKIDIKGKNIFLPRSNLSGKGLAKAFEKLGAKVSESSAYRNVMPQDLPALDLNKFDEIMFTSPSTVRNFIKRYRGAPGHVKIRCVGDVTLREARRCRLLD